MSQKFQSERLIDALIRADRYQADQTVIQMRDKQHSGFGKGDVTTNGASVPHSHKEHCDRKVKWGWF
jgi:hypothetical protein